MSKGVHSTKLTRQQCRKALGKADLFSFLILPIQRIPRYVLLLRDLVIFASRSAFSASALEQPTVLSWTYYQRVADKAYAARPS